MTKLYGNKYFGKQGITSKGTKRDKTKKINLQDIIINLEKYGKKTGKGFEINLKNHKILGSSKILPKEKLIINAKDASKSAISKVKKSGGDIILNKRK